MKTPLLCMLLLYSCSSTPKKKRTMQLSIIKDATSFHAIAPDATMILSKMDMKTDEDKAVVFRLLAITDKTLNATKTLTLHDAQTTDKQNTQEIVHYRKKLIRQFYQNIRTAVSQFNEATTYDSAPKSECFRTIAGELARMKKTGATTNILQIFSDLQENSTLFSSYHRGDIAFIEHHADSIVRRLNKVQILPERLDGFEIMIIYCPPNRSADIAFRRMADIYRKLLESRGATITFQANN